MRGRQGSVSRWVSRNHNAPKLRDPECGYGRDLVWNGGSARNDFLVAETDLVFRRLRLPILTAVDPPVAGTAKTSTRDYSCFPNLSSISTHLSSHIIQRRTQSPLLGIHEQSRLCSRHTPRFHISYPSFQRLEFNGRVV